MRDGKTEASKGRQVSFWSHNADLLDKATVGKSRSAWLDRVATAAAKEALARKSANR